MVVKVPQIHLDVLAAYEKMGSKEIVGKNLTQIAESLGLDYSTIYVMNVSSLLIRRGYLVRNIKDNGAVSFLVTKSGSDLLRENSMEAPAIESKVEKMDTAKDKQQKPEARQPEFTEGDKEKAILSLLNETLVKTVLYCKDLSAQISTAEKEEHIAEVEAENIKLKSMINTNNILIDAYEKDIEKLRESVPTLMAQLKCSIDSKLDEHYELIPWQRELMKEELRKAFLLLVDETLEDIEKVINNDDES